MHYNYISRTVKHLFQSGIKSMVLVLFSHKSGMKIIVFFGSKLFQYHSV